MIDRYLLGHLAIWGLFGLIWFLLIPKRTGMAVTTRRKSYNGALYISGTLFTICHMSGFTAYEPLFHGQKFLGLVITFLGFLLALVARLAIGQHWSFHAIANEDGTFVESFPYSLVRHPIYTAQLIMCLGTSFSACNHLAGTMFVFGTYLLLRQRAVKEEQNMDAHSGGAYSRKFSPKGRFFPRWSAFSGGAPD